MSDLKAAKKLDKGIALLKSLVSPHEPGRNDSDHEWRKCRRCLAHEELEHKGVDDALTAVINAVTEQAQQIAELRAALARYGEHRATCPQPLHIFGISQGRRCTCGLDALLAEGAPWLT